MDRSRGSHDDPGRAQIVPFSVLRQHDDAGPAEELRALSARLAELAHMVDAALVDAEVDAVAALVASVEAVAAGHLAERHAADEHQAVLTAEEAAEIAENLAGEAGRERDQAIAEAVALATRAQETEARAATEIERAQGLLEEAMRGAQLRVGVALAGAAERMERADARAAQACADADARLDAERSARVAAQRLADGLTGERDRLLAQLAAQVDRDAASLAALARAVQAAEGRAEALGAELAGLRRLTPRSPMRRRHMATEQQSRVNQPAG